MYFGNEKKSIIVNICAVPLHPEHSQGEHHLQIYRLGKQNRKKNKTKQGILQTESRARATSTAPSAATALKESIRILHLLQSANDGRSNKLPLMEKDRGTSNVHFFQVLLYDVCLVGPCTHKCTTCEGYTKHASHVPYALSQSADIRRWQWKPR